MNKHSLKEKVVLVGGGAKNLGGLISHAFATDGARICVHYNSASTKKDADKTVAAENSVLFYLALRKAGVAAEMHIYERGAHGAGLGVKDAILASWPSRLADWMSLRGLTK